jgi:hypothetical protein
MRLDMMKSKRCFEALQVYNARSSERFIGPRVQTPALASGLAANLRLKLFQIAHIRQGCRKFFGKQRLRVLSILI